MAKKMYDYLVIGGGSGGLASARRAGKYGAKVALIEATPRLGGTCVNVGCVPKKVMFNASFIADCLRDHARNYGFHQAGSPAFNWRTFKVSRDEYIKRLNGIYSRNLANDGVEQIHGFARFVGPNQLVLEEDSTGTIYEGKHVLIATGGHPLMPAIPGVEFCLSSDGFFDLAELPKKAAVIGAGYIAVEIAGVLHSLGCEVTLYIRYDRPLRTFDETISVGLLEEMEAAGIRVMKHSHVTAAHAKASTLSSPSYRDLTETPNAIDIVLDVEDGKGETVQQGPFQTVIMAIGRQTNINRLGLDLAGVKVNEKGYIQTDSFQNTSQPSTYAVGDVCGPALLTPVAIAAGRKLSDRLFGGNKDACVDYTNIPSVVFSHPPVAAIGLTEAESRKQYDEKAITIYTSKFTNMFYALGEKKSRTIYKLICVGPEERVVGVHLLGMSSDEIMQGFAVAVKMGATKKDFDQTMAIHPTAAEELVTMR